MKMRLFGSKLGLGSQPVANSFGLMRLQVLVVQVEVVQNGAIMSDSSSKSPTRYQSVERNCGIRRQQHSIDTGGDSPSRRGVAARRAEKSMSGMQLSEVSFELIVGGVDFLQGGKDGSLRKGKCSFYFFSLMIVTDEGAGVPRSR